MTKQEGMPGTVTQGHAGLTPVGTRSRLRHFTKRPFIGSSPRGRQRIAEGGRQPILTRTVGAMNGGCEKSDERRHGAASWVFT